MKLSTFAKCAALPRHQIQVYIHMLNQVTWRWTIPANFAKVEYRIRLVKVWITILIDTINDFILKKIKDTYACLLPSSSSEGCVLSAQTIVSAPAVLKHSCSVSQPRVTGRARQRANAHIYAQCPLMCANSIMPTKVCQIKTLFLH